MQSLRKKLPFGELQEIQTEWLIWANLLISQENPLNESSHSETQRA